jgi:hypothetical protein
MKLDIKRKYKKMYRQLIADIPLTKDQYGDWELIHDDEDEGFRIEFYEKLMPFEEDEPHVALEKKVYYHADTWYNTKHLGLQTETPNTIRYYKKKWDPHDKLVIPIKIVHFYPSGFIEREWNDESANTRAYDLYVDDYDYIPNSPTSTSQHYKDGEKVLQ